MTKPTVILDTSFLGDLNSLMQNGANAGILDTLSQNFTIISGSQLAKEGGGTLDSDLTLEAWVDVDRGQASGDPG